MDTPKFGNVFSRSIGEGRVQLLEEVGEIVASEGPFEWVADPGEVAFKLMQAVGDGGEVGEIVWCEHLPLHDGEVDLDLIEPACMTRRVNELDPRIPRVGALYGARTAVRGPVIDDPEDAASVPMRRAGHDLIDEPVEGLDAGRRFAASDDGGVMYIERGQVRPSAPAFVFVFNAHGPPGVGWPCPSRIPHHAAIGSWTSPSQ